MIDENIQKRKKIDGNLCDYYCENYSFERKFVENKIQFCKIVGLVHCAPEIDPSINAN